MPRRQIHLLAHALEQRLDRRARGRRVAGGRVVISPYHGFGRQGELLVRGRVIVEKSITRASEAEPLWRNVINSYRRFRSEEVAGARVTGRYRDAVAETVSDEEGHFQLRLDPQVMSLDALWHEVTLELEGGSYSTVARLVVPMTATNFGIISDIDDTIVETNATSLAKMATTVLLHNARSRTPFEGVSDLYRALHSERNPVFYVSSSPWNLYELLHDYMGLNDIPHGPMFLQDWGIDEKTLFKSSHHDHKLEQIQLLLEYYPDLRFILIGDSGQHDPEIYLRVIQSNPGRILAAVIRDVTVEHRDQGVTRIAEEARTAGVEMIYVQQSNEALEQLKALGVLDDSPVPATLPS